MNYQLFILFTIGLCGFMASGQTPFMDSNCKSYVQKDMVKGSYELGRGIDRIYNWDLIKTNYQDKADDLKGIIKNTGTIHAVSEKTKYCAGYPNPPSECSSFQAHCLRELKNRGLGDLFQAWSLRLDECINNPLIKDPQTGKDIKYMEVYGKNCESEKVIRNVKGVQYIKNDFDKIDANLPDDVKALWEELNQKYSQWENSKEKLANGRAENINDEKKENDFLNAKSEIDNILDECKHHFDLSLAGHIPTTCDAGDTLPFSEKDKFKDFISEMDNISNAKDIVLDVADKDIEKAVIARLYVALVSGEAKHNKASLSKAMCSVKGEKSRFDFCSKGFDKKRSELIDKAMSVLPKDLPQIDIDAEMKNINKSLSQIKPLCQKIKKAESTISMSWMASDPKDSAYNKKFVRGMRSDGYRDKKKLSAEVRKVYVDTLMANSMIPGMMGTEALNRLRLSETIDNCDIQPVKRNDVLKAIQESRKISLESINENIEHKSQQYSYKHKDRLNDILRTNPEAVYSAIVNKENPKLASYICTVLKSNRFKKRLYTGVKILAVGALVAVSFVPGAAAATVPLATALTTVELGEAAYEMHQGNKDKRAYIQQGVADQFVNFEGLNAADEQIDGAITNAAVEIALEWGTVGLGKAFKTAGNLINTRTVRKNSHLKINKADYKKLTNSGKSNIEKYFNNNTLSPDMSNSLSRFSKDPISSEYIRLFTSKMSPDEVKRFFDELSRFKSKDEFIAFSKNISTDQLGSVDDFFIAMGRYKSNGQSLEVLAGQTDKKLKSFKNQGQSNSQVTKGTVFTESQEAAQKYLGRKLSPGELDAVERAHLVGKGEIGKNGSKAHVGNYTFAQIRNKQKILEQAGLTSNDIRILMKNKVVGDKAPVKIMNVDELYDRKDVVLGIKNSSDKLENTKKVQDYYKSLKNQEKAIKDKVDSGGFVSSKVKKKVQDDIEWIDDFIKRQEADGNLEANTFQLIKNKTDKATNITKKKAALLETSNKSQRQKAFNTIKEETKKFRNSNFYESLGLSNKNYNHAAKVEAEAMIKELKASREALSKQQSKIKNMGSDVNTRDANILIQQSLKNIDQKILNLSKRTNEIDNVNAGYVKTLSEIQKNSYQKTNIKEIIKDAKKEGELIGRKVADDYLKRIDEQMDVLNKLKQRKTNGTVSEKDIPGFEKIDIDREISKLEVKKKEISSIFKKNDKKDIGQARRSSKLPATSKEFTEMSVRDPRFVDDVSETYLKELNTAVYDDFYQGYYKSSKDTPYVDTLKKMHSRYQSYKGTTSGAAKQIRPGVIRDELSDIPIHALGKANFKKASGNVKESLGKMKPGENIFKIPDNASTGIKQRYQNIEDLNKYYSPEGRKISKSNYFKERLDNETSESVVKYMKSKYKLQPIEAEQLLNVAKNKNYDDVANEAFRLAHKHEHSDLLSEIVNKSDGKVGDLLEGHNIKTVDVEMVKGIPSSDKNKIINFSTDSSAPRYRLMVFPKGKSLRSYENVLNNKMKNLKVNGSKMTNDQFIDEVAEFYHTGINGHIFEKGNNSLMMTQINVMLKDRGLRHISHGRLDFNAFSQNLNDFKGTFKQSILDAQK